jgi:hypothetical protein
MILFAADNHYGTHPGKVLHEQISDSYDIRFFEDDWSCFEDQSLMASCDLLVLNMISGCCDIPAPGQQGIDNVRAYCEAGGSLLLLHGASAAFWQCDWWRPIVGHRWVRGNDPDGFEPSTHPRQPYTITPAKCRHSLCAQLQVVELPEDEIYTELEQTCPTMVLMTTEVNGKTYPQCYEATSPWGGRILGFLPGHDEAAVRTPALVANCRLLIDSLLG